MNKKISLLLLLALPVIHFSCVVPPEVPVISETQAPYVSPVTSPPVSYVPTPNLPRQTIMHEVAPLESLWRISKMYNVTQDSIIRANNLVSSELNIGQKLVIPNANALRPIISLYPNPRWKFIVIHHTASDVGNALMVNSWHHTRGFENGLGYHFLIDNGTSGKQNGQIETAPRWIKQEPGAHCKAGDMNEKGIGICLVGNFSEDYPSKEQMDSLIFIVRELMEYYRIPPHRVIRHGEAPGAMTECPGLRFPWADFKRKIQS